MTAPGPAIVHTTRPDGTTPRCGASTGAVVPWAETLAPGGRHFTCPRCQADVTGGQRHVSPPVVRVSEPHEQFTYPAGTTARGVLDDLPPEGADD